MLRQIINATKNAAPQFYVLCAPRSREIVIDNAHRSAVDQSGARAAFGATRLVADGHMDDRSD